MKKIFGNESDKLAIVTVAVGANYYSNWDKFAKKSWIAYAKRHSISIYIETEDLDLNNPPKKKQWQKLLLGRSLRNLNKNIDLICYLDTDILINEYAPNIFEYHVPKTIGLVSKFHNLPYDRNLCLRRIAFLRNKFISSNYPLDSALFMDNEQLYKYQNLEPQEDYACTGLILFEAERHSDFLASIFDKYQAPVFSITDGGEEVHVNYEIQKNMNVNWLDYKFQTFWTYEIAWKYPFLYMKKNSNLIGECIKSSLWGTYFIHFAGSWNEGEHWTISKNIYEPKWIKLLQEFYKYLNIPVEGKPVGKILPIKKNNFNYFSQLTKLFQKNN